MSLLMLILVFITSALLILYLLWKRAVSRFPNIQFAPCVPILGSIPLLETDPHEFTKQLVTFAQKYNYLYVLWFTFYPRVVIGSVDYAEIFLSSKEHISKSANYKLLQNWLGTGLLLSTGEKWRKRRKLITPTFHFSILNQFQIVIIKHANVLVEKLKNFANNNEEFDVQTVVSLATLDIICETAMGVSKNVQMNTNSLYIRAICNTFKGLQKRDKSPWLWSDLVYPHTRPGKEYYNNLKVLHNFTSQVISDRISKKQEASSQLSTGQPKAFLDMLLELYERNEIDCEGIQEEVDTFMFEGHDTTSSALSWTLYCLGKYPDIQRKLHAKIDRMSNGEGSLVERIKNLKYLENVLKEAMRLYSPVPIISRNLERDTVVNNHLFPAGTTIAIDVFAIHTNPAYWDDPLEFRPERFSDENFKKRHPYCYIPFSAGPRNCIGQKFAMLEEMILLYFIMLNFEVQLTGKEIRSVFAAIHKSDNGIFVKVVKRQ